MNIYCVTCKANITQSPNRKCDCGSDLAVWGETLIFDGTTFTCSCDNPQLHRVTTCSKDNHLIHAHICTSCGNVFGSETEV